jgi:hypothetical protein
MANQVTCDCMTGLHASEMRAAGFLAFICQYLSDSGLVTISIYSRARGARVAAICEHAGMQVLSSRHELCPSDGFIIAQRRRGKLGKAAKGLKGVKMLMMRMIYYRKHVRKTN